MLHLNDSKASLGSNRDRHENIGEGELGLPAFQALMRHPDLADVPGILEVPGYDGEGPDQQNVETLRRLAVAPL
jgi:deoxyribonuclease-4